MSVPVLCSFDSQLLTSPQPGGPPVAAGLGLQHLSKRDGAFQFVLGHQLLDIAHGKVHHPALGRRQQIAHVGHDDVFHVRVADDFL